MRRKLFLLAGVATLALYLSSCTPPDPLAARIVDGRLEFTSCESLDVAEIRVRVAPLGTRDWSTAWLIQGELRLGEGDIIKFGELPAGWESVTGPDLID